MQKASSSKNKTPILKPIKANKMNQTQLMATTHVDDLSILIEKMSHEVPKINDTVNSILICKLTCFKY